MLCQLLEARGVTVIGTASDEAKFTLAKANGATHMINYKATSGPSWVEQVKELTNGHGVNAVNSPVQNIRLINTRLTCPHRSLIASARTRGREVLKSRRTEAKSSSLAVPVCPIIG
jgi:Zn-dependent alcohol dehydrogenase